MHIWCVLLSERSQSKKSTHCMSPTLWHSGKGKALETIKKMSDCEGQGIEEEKWTGGE